MRLVTFRLTAIMHACKRVVSLRDRSEDCLVILPWCLIITEWLKKVRSVKYLML